MRWRQESRSPANGSADFKTFSRRHSCWASVTAVRADEALLIDAALTAAAAKPDLLAGVARGGPYGAGNPEPVFALPAHRLVEVATVGNGHLRLRAEAGDGAKIDGIAFRAAATPVGEALLLARGTVVHLAGTLAVDRYGGRERVQLRLLDMAPAAQTRASMASPLSQLARRDGRLYMSPGRRRPTDRSVDFRAHRLAVQDVALSRRKQGFDSPWARQ